MNTRAAQLVNRAADLAGAYGMARTLPERIDAYSLATLVVELARNWCPWGSSAKSRLTRTQRDTVRRWLFLMERNHLRPPWLYYPKTRRWYVDVRRYPTLEHALDWLSRHRLTANEWLQLSQFG
jgi:hypothetical protein